ncbi:hypothetical protein [Promicromonospora sp. NFX87]|uniref:hypothetical protein n=1 Tax=Promicromonospora sp. NFX87 TaxID=3402691 RepID=UPI003AFA0832
MSTTRRTTLLDSRMAVARHAGVTPATISLWITKGWLPETGPWTRRQVTAAGNKSRQRGGRGPQSPHGSPGRWRTGCPCDLCRAGHDADTRARREAVRVAWWQPRENPLLAELTAGVTYREALDKHGIAPAALTAHRRRDPGFAARLDRALMAGRNPELAHGAPNGWRAGCRCPDCRGYHEGTRTSAR